MEPTRRSVSRPLKLPSRKKARACTPRGECSRPGISLRRTLMFPSEDKLYQRIVKILPFCFVTWFVFALMLLQGAARAVTDADGSSLSLQDSANTPAALNAE